MTEMPTSDKQVARHPIQPLVKDGLGVLRFKSNAIVDYLLEHGGINLNDLHRVGFPKEEWEQFHQLIGYSHSGVPGVSDEVWQAAEGIYAAGISELEARCNYLRGELDAKLGRLNVTEALTSNERAPLGPMTREELERHCTSMTDDRDCFYRIADRRRAEIERLTRELETMTRSRNEYFDCYTAQRAEVMRRADETTERRATRIVERIEDDMLDRSGLGNALDEIMIDDREAIRQKWRQIVVDELSI